MRWHCFAASVVGEDHLSNGQPMQDRVAFRSDQKRPFIAVADGLGSCSRSAEGARAAVDAAMQSLRWWQQIPEAPIEPVIRALYQRWLMEIHPIGKADAKSTILAAAAAADGCVLTVQLGDGVILIEDNQSVRLHAETKPMEFANETLSLGGEMSIADWQWTVHPSGSIHGVVMASDGVANGLDPTEWRALVGHLRSLRLGVNGVRAAQNELAKQLREWPLQAAGGDDRSLACLFMTEEEDE